MKVIMIICKLHSEKNVLILRDTLKDIETLFYIKKNTRTWILELLFEWFSCIHGSTPKL